MTFMANGINECLLKTKKLIIGYSKSLNIVIEKPEFADVIVVIAENDNDCTSVYNYGKNADYCACYLSFFSCQTHSPFIRPRARYANPEEVCQSYRNKSLILPLYKGFHEKNTPPHCVSIFDLY